MWFVFWENAVQKKSQGPHFLSVSGWNRKMPISKICLLVWVVESVGKIKRFSSPSENGKDCIMTLDSIFVWSFALTRNMVLLLSWCITSKKFSNPSTTKEYVPSSLLRCILKKGKFRIPWHMSNNPLLPCRRKRPIFGLARSVMTNFIWEGFVINLVLQLYCCKRLFEMSLGYQKLKIWRWASIQKRLFQLVVLIFRTYPIGVTFLINRFWLVGCSLVLSPFRNVLKQ